MAYRFRIGDKIGKALSRIGGEQLQRSEALLASSPKEGAETAIHETRKALKRVRALLRIVREAVPQHAFACENERLRDIARLLSGARDRHVLAATLSGLEAGAADDEDLLAAITAARAALAATAGGSVTQADMAKARARLGEARAALGQIDVSDDGFAALAGGLQRTYRQGRKAFGPGAEAGGDEEWHEARKAVQVHWRHMALMTRVWPDAMLARVRLARRLSEMLGEDHDLAVLRAFAASHLDKAHLRAIAGAVDERQERLRAKALPLGAMLFAEKPDAFVARIAGYWEAGARAKRAGADLLDAREADAGKADAGKAEVAGGPESARMAGAGADDTAPVKRTSRGRAA